MHIEVLSENAFARKVNVKVPASTVKDALDRAFRDIANRARLPGFRKGKVPRRVLEARFGPSVLDDVAGDLIQKGWEAVLSEHSLEPVSRPSVVERGEVSASADFVFVIGVEVRPSVEANVIDGLEVYWPKWEVSDKEVDDAVERQRLGQSRLTAVTGRPVEAGDTVQVEVTGKSGDEVVLSEPGTLVRVNGDAWLAGLEDFLIGLSVDGEKSGDVTFEDTARNKDVAGKTLDVTVKVLGIQAQEAPPLDDALAEELGYDNVAAMRDAVRNSLTKGREEQARNQARANLLEALIAANPFDVPQGMIEQNLQLLMEELKVQQAYRGVDPRQVRFSEAQIADLRGRAGFAARGGLLLEAVSASQKIEVPDDEVEARIKELAEDRGQTVEAIKGFLQQDDAMEDLRQRLLEEKTLDFLLARAKVTHEAPADLAGEDQVEAAEPAPKKAAKKATKKAEAEAAPVEAAPAEEPAPKKAAKKATKKTEAEAAPAEEPEPAKKASGGSKYKTIAGVKYARDILEMGEAAGDVVDLATIKAIVAAAGDGKGITDVEKRSIAYVRDNHNLAANAKTWLAKNVDLD